MSISLKEIANANYEVVKGPYAVHTTDELGVTTRNLHAGSDVTRTNIEVTRDLEDGGSEQVRVTALAGILGTIWTVARDDNNQLCVVGVLKKKEPEVEAIASVPVGICPAAE